MRRSIAALASALCVIGVAACSGGSTEPAAGGAVATGTQTVTGQVVDLYCYNPETKENAGMHHGNDKECAWACAKWEAQPVGIVTDNGTVYQLAGGLIADNNAKIAPHVTHKVTITGDVAERHGVMVLTADDLQMAASGN
jgi:hypothetical protein